MLPPSHGADSVSAVDGMSGHVTAIVYALAALGRSGADHGRLTLYPVSPGSRVRPEPVRRTLAIDARAVRGQHRFQVVFLPARPSHGGMAG